MPPASGSGPIDPVITPVGLMVIAGTPNRGTTCPAIDPPAVVNVPVKGCAAGSVDDSTGPLRSSEMEKVPAPALTVTVIVALPLVAWTVSFHDPDHVPASATGLMIPGE